MAKIHINQHVIRKNKSENLDLPAITVKDGKHNRYAREVEILGPSKIVYQPNQPLSCGARVWIETDAELKLTDEISYSELKAFL